MKKALHDIVHDSTTGRINGHETMTCLRNATNNERNCGLEGKVTGYASDYFQ